MEKENTISENKTPNNNKNENKSISKQNKNGVNSKESKSTNLKSTNISNEKSTQQKGRVQQSKTQNNGKNRNTENSKRKKPVGLIVAVSILGATTLGLAGWAAYSTVDMINLKNNMNTIYQKSYYNFYDALNNTETKMNKLINTTDTNMSKKLLNEISKNANEAQSALNYLPVSVNGVEKSLAFINQVGGYTSSLAKKLDSGGVLSNEDKQTLVKLNTNITDMRKNLNNMTNNMNGGYDILNNSLKLDGDYNNFTVSLQSMNSSDVEYPAMIYDGPFADSQVKKEVKGLNFAEVDKETALENLSTLVNVARENLVYKGENRGKIVCYNIEWQDDNKNTFFAQITKNGGRLLSLTSQKDSSDTNLKIDNAINIAKQFLSENKISDVECVWTDTIEGNAYLNFAPIENNIILYPDLVKLKIDLADGIILGFEATSYFTNHTERSFQTFVTDKATANSKIESKFNIETTKKVLVPIEYQEVFCWEVKCNYAENTYYFYFDSQTGQTVNILKVIKTSDGSKLM